MNAKDAALLFTFDPPELLSDHALVLCPNCNTYTALQEWKDAEPFCEDCGNHLGMSCPECGDAIDAAYQREPLTLTSSEEEDA